MSSLAEILGKGVPGNVRASDGTGGTLTLTRDDYRTQVFNLTAAKAVKLPTTGIKKGETFVIAAQTGVDGVSHLTIQASDASELTAATSGMPASIMRGYSVIQALIDTPVTATDWVVLDSRENGATLTTWTGNGTGPSTSGTNTIYWQRDGLAVTASPQNTVVVTAGSSGTTKLFNNTALPTRLRPLTGAMIGLATVRDNNANVNQPGAVVITTAGVIECYRDLIQTAFSVNNTSGIGTLSGLQIMRWHLLV